MDFSKNTVYFFYIKMVDILKTIIESTKLSWKIESYKIYLAINLKGTKTKDTPIF